MNPQSQAKALENAPLNRGDAAKFWREPRYDDLECLAARFRTHVYERHTHETYVIGCITAGYKRFELSGAQYAARAGDLCFVHPDVVHDGRPEGDGYAYRMIYQSRALLADLTKDITGSAPCGTLTFRFPLAHDPELSAEFEVHRALEKSHAALQADEAMRQVLGRILGRYARLAVSAKPHEERRAVRKARDYLAANVTENVDLATLAGISGLSRSRSVRSSRKWASRRTHSWSTGASGWHERCCLAARLR
jgi:AraC-like DNA-binding protein